MHNVRKILSRVLCAILMVSTLSSCNPPEREGAVGIPPQSGIPTKENAVSSMAEPSGQQKPQTIHMLLPKQMQLFGEKLAALAEKDGNTLKVRTSPEGVSYNTLAKEQLAGDNPPDVVWLEGGGALLALERPAGEGFLNLQEAESGPVLGGLADMVPPASRLPGNGKMAGLPLGYYTEGYIVNLERLAALLGTTADSRLIEDIYACNWQQWMTLVRSVESYLAKPGRIDLSIGSKKYTMAGYRPAIAQQLRGVFAVPTADSEKIIGNSMDILMGLCYQTPAEILEVNDAEKTALMRPVMASLMGLLELESMHMAQKNGPLRRGENYYEQETFTQNEAEELFVNGSALFLRGDTRQGFRLEKEYPNLSGKLAIIPVKLPPPAYIEQAGLAAEQDISSQAEEDSSASAAAAPSANSGEMVIPDDVANEIINNSNLGLWYASDGMLCINNESESKEGAASLLLRLYTTEEGQKLIQETLHLYPFSEPYPASTMMRQVAGEIDESGWQLVADPSSLVRTREIIGTFVQEQLYGLYLWDSMSQQRFLTQGFAAQGLQYTPQQTRVTKNKQNTQSNSQ